MAGIEPVYNGPVLSGHSVLSDHFSKSRCFFHRNTIFVTCIKRPLVLFEVPRVAVIYRFNCS